MKLQDTIINFTGMSSLRLRKNLRGHKVLKINKFDSKIKRLYCEGNCNNDCYMAKLELWKYLR